MTRVKRLVQYQVLVVPQGLSLIKTSGHHFPQDRHKINDLKYLSNLHVFHNTNNLNVKKKAHVVYHHIIPIFIHLSYTYMFQL